MKRLLLYTGIILICSLLHQTVWAQGQTMIFSATGDIPYGSNEIPIFQQQIADHNLYSPSAFLIHVGDIKDGSSPCTESHYQTVSGILKNLAVPAYIVPGDNEYNDCSNPTQAWQYWTTYFMNFEENFCGAFDTEHQDVRQENFAFVLDGVLFVGINLVGGRVHNQNEWNTRMQQDADWVSYQFQNKKPQVRAAVVFAQAGPNNSNRDLFFNQFRPAAATFVKPVLFLHGDGHSWKLDKPFPEQNITRVQVDNGAAEDPVQVTVNMDPTNPWVFKRNPWANNPPLYNVKPCVEAGPDTTVMLPGIANLHARVKDDGVPLNPGAVTLTWSKVSGPGAVTFGNPGSATTTASFSTAGSYVLRLTANDGALQNYDELTVNALTSNALLSINDVSITEGNSGASNAVFTVSLTGGNGSAVSVQYATVGNTATQGVDYTGVSGMLNFSGSTTSRTISVPVIGDTDIEPDETFFVNLSNVSNAIIADSQGIGTIINDDFPPAPSITSFSPSQGPVGTEVTISGSNFVMVSEVAFNAAIAGNYVVDSPTQIRATVPAGATSGKIRVTNVSGNGLSAADFMVTHTLAVTTYGSGTVSLDPPGGSYTLGTTVTLTAIPDPGWEFAGWSGDLSGFANPDSLLMDANKSVTATFTRHFSLTVNIEGGGAVALDPPGGVYDSLEVVTLTATPDSGWVFAGWSGNMSGSANPDSLLMDANKSVTATFTRRFSLTVNIAGGGAVALDPSGGVYDSLEVVTLAATPDSGWVFAGWSGDLSGSANPDSIVMNSDKAVAATFSELPRYPLTITPVGLGTVSLDPPGGLYYQGATVILTAIPDSGYIFSSWSGDLSGSANPDTILIDTAKQVTATFTELPRYSLTVNISGPGSVTLYPPGGTYYAGTPVILSAVPDPDYLFYGWSGDLSGAENPDTVIINGDMNVTAAFADLSAFQFTVTAHTIGSGSVALSPPGGVYTGGTTVTATAIPAAGYDFLGWSGDASGPLNPEALFMDSDKHITAEFAPRGAGSVAFEEAVSGGGSNTNSVTTSAAITGVSGNLYLASITTRQNIAVSSVSGLGLTWTLVDAQCAARSQTRVEVWMAQGTPAPSGTVSATLASNANSVLIAVSRYSGVDPSAPVGAVVSSNTLGIDGACSNGNDNSAYSFNLITTSDSSVVYAAVAPRTQSHTPGAGYVQRVFSQQGSGGDLIGIALQDQKFGGPAPATVNGTFSNSTDWAVIAVEIKPGETAGAPTYALNLNIDGAGSVALNPPGGYYSAGRVVTLSATPDSGWVFAGWSGDLSGSANPDSLVMNADKTVTATFERLSPLTVRAKVFLEGVYHGGGMNTNLNAMGGLPLSQPYDRFPWNYAGGEAVDSLPAGAVDWVLVSLRTSPETSDLTARAALLASDGALLDTNGVAGVAFEGVGYDDYYIVVYHRNHLPVMSATAQGLDGGSSEYDFTVALNRAYGTNPMKELGTGVYGMFSGDGNADGVVNEADKESVWRPENGTPWSYDKFADFNLDGGIDVLDLNYCWRANVGAMSGVPGITAAKGLPPRPGSIEKSSKVIQKSSPAKPARGLKESASNATPKQIE